MFGCYRKDEVADPEFYLTAAVAILTRYEKQTVLRVTDPRNGLPASSKFLPSIAEIREACEREQAVFDREAARLERLRDQLRRRVEDENLDYAARPTVAELKEKHGDDWGISSAGEDSEKQRKEDLRLNIARANKTFLARECAAAGVDLSHGVSPALLKTLRR